MLQCGAILDDDGGGRRWETVEKHLPNNNLKMVVDVAVLVRRRIFTSFFPPTHVLRRLSHSRTLSTELLNFPGENLFCLDFSDRLFA